jgi:hypothetical protein
MRRNFTLLAFCFLGSSVYAQSDTTYFGRPSISIGIDVFKNVPPLLLGDSYFIQNAVIIEPSLRVNYKPGSAWLIHLGVMKASTNRDLEVENILSKNIKGVYFKAGLEREFERRKSMVVGWNGLLAVANHDGAFQLGGPTFGDYRGNYFGNSAALGAEMYFAYNSSLKAMWNVRTQFRMALAFRVGGTVKPYYYPGVGVTGNMSNLLFSAGGTVQVFRKIR